MTRVMGATLLLVGLGSFLHPEKRDVLGAEPKRV